MASTRNKDFVKRFKAMVQTLRAHPRVEVYEVVIRPPADKATLREAEAALGRPLPADLRSFYATCDGVFLEWGLRDHPQPERTPLFGYPDYGAPPGCINLLPVGHAMSSHWEAESHVNEIQDDQWIALYGAVPDPRPPFGSVCIDNFSRYNHADLILGPEPLVVVSTDHGADMDSSDYCSFATYLDLTLSIWGTNRYYEGLGIGWTRQAKLCDAWRERPTLDAMVEKLLGNRS